MAGNGKVEVFNANLAKDADNETKYHYRLCRAGCGSASDVMGIGRESQASKIDSLAP